MLVEVWIDYLCPWAYLGQDRSELLRSLGFEIRSRPYELHPDLPLDGRPVSADGRLARTYERIAAECEAVDLPFRVPQHVPSTRVAHVWSEAVAAAEPSRHEAVVAALMAANFVDGADIGDPTVVERVIGGTGVDVESVRGLVEDGSASASVERSMAEAREIGVAATPAWRFPSGFILPGVQPREQVERWARRLAERAGTAADTP